MRYSLLGPSVLCTVPAAESARPRPSRETLGELSSVRRVSHDAATGYELLPGNGGLAYPPGTDTDQTPVIAKRCGRRLTG